MPGVWYIRSTGTKRSGVCSASVIKGSNGLSDHELMQHESTWTLAVPLNNSSSASFQACKSSGRFKQAHRKTTKHNGTKAASVVKTNKLRFRVEPDVQPKRVGVVWGVPRGESHLTHARTFFKFRDLRSANVCPADAHASQSTCMPARISSRFSRHSFSWSCADRCGGCFGGYVMNPIPCT